MLFPPSATFAFFWQSTLKTVSEVCSLLEIHDLLWNFQIRYRKPREKVRSSHYFLPITHIANEFNSVEYFTCLFQFLLYAAPRILASLYITEFHVSERFIRTVTLFSISFREKFCRYFLSFPQLFMLSFSHV